MIELENKLYNLASNMSYMVEEIYSKDDIVYKLSIALKTLYSNPNINSIDGILLVKAWKLLLLLQIVDSLDSEELLANVEKQVDEFFMNLEGLDIPELLESFVRNNP